MSCFSPVGASESIAPERQQLTAALLDDWLCWAGSRLLAMPSERIKPSLPKAIWPDYAIEQFQVLEFRKKPKFRIPPPSKDEIPIMEKILLFPNYCEDTNRRRVLHLRLLVNPVSFRPINTWKKTAGLIKTSISRTKRIHSQALEEARLKIPAEMVAAVSEFFANSSEF